MFGGTLMYNESTFKKLWSVIKKIAHNLQGKNYIYLLIPTLVLSGLSIYQNQGFQSYDGIFRLSSYLVDDMKLFIIDTLAGLLCLLLIIPTCLLWWNLSREKSFVVHLPVLLFIPALLLGGLIFSNVFILLLVVVLLVISLFWIWFNIWPNN